MDLRRALTSHSNQIFSVTEQFFEDQIRQSEKIDRYLTRSVTLLRDFTLRGGKDIRSFLSLLGFEIAHGKKKAGLLAALASVEMHHKHILILDDISDRDETRYGGPTLEYAYRAALAGLADQEHKSRSFAMMDATLLGAFAKELLLSSDFSTEIKVACIHILNTIMFRDTLAGWQIHGMQCTQPLREATQEEFIKGLRYVTASYTFEGPLLIGLTLAENKDKKLEQALRIYAEHVGTAFQMHDDILGLFGDSQVTGKPVGNDVREGKKTLLLQEAYARASQDEKKTLEIACGNDISSDMLAEVQRIVRETGSLEYSKKLEREYVERGIAALSNLKQAEPVNLLIELAHYIITREK